jgi:hypothetical protein
MTARLPLVNDLQREFAQRAHTERSGYILPWTRGGLRKSSSLDDIYTNLGQANLNYQNLRQQVTNLSQDKKRRYNKTLIWLFNQVLMGDYVQRGNSCGAWCLTHWRMRDSNRYYGGHEFTTAALQAYNNVKFQATDGVYPRPPLLGIWSNIAQLGGPYSNPWKIVQQLPGSSLKLEAGARAFAAARTAGVPVVLDDMLQAVNALRPGAVAAIANENLNNLPVNGRAIIVAFAPPPVATPLGINVLPLHYKLLVRTAGGWILYNSNSHKLTPTVLGGCPAFNAPVATNLETSQGVAAGTQNYRFAGLFIRV